MTSTPWPELYADYLKSQQWADKRDRVLRRANYHCEGCAQRPATDVHHLTYEHVTQEFLFELVALCRECHARVHEQSDDRPKATTWTPKHGSIQRPAQETPIAKAMRHRLGDLAAEARAKLMATPAPADALAPEHIEEPIGEDYEQGAAA